jgi:Uma2 family endonuclease
MSLPATRYIRPDEYLSFERPADTKHEYVAGLVYPRDDPDHPVDPNVVLGLRTESRKPMTGGTEIHSAVKVNLTIALGVLLANRPCRVYDSDLRFRPDEESYFYPDLFVMCGERARPGTGMEARDPLLVIEVLSPSTERIDRITKLRRYTQAPSVREYLLVNTRFPEVVVHRLEEKGWRAVVFGPDDPIWLESLGVTLEFSAIYKDVLWDVEAPEAEE